jgi:hypothetical protein
MITVCPCEGEPTRQVERKTAADVSRRAAALIRKNELVLGKARRLLDRLRAERDVRDLPVLDPKRQKQARDLIATEFP